MRRSSRRMLQREMGKKRCTDIYRKIRRNQQGRHQDRRSVRFKEIQDGSRGSDRAYAMGNRGRSDRIRDGTGRHGSGSDPEKTGRHDRESPGHCAFMYYAPIIRTRRKTDVRTAVQGAFIADATREHTKQGTDAFERSGASLLPEGITGNQLLQEDGRGTRISNIDV